MTGGGLRLGGAALLAAACAAGGFEGSARARRRVAEVRGLAAAVAVLQTEVAFAATPLPDALRRAGRAAGGEVGDLLVQAAALLGRGTDGAEAAWRDAVTAARGRLSLRPSDLDGMAELAASLGRSDREDQTRHLARAAARLQALAEGIEPEMERSARLMRSLGVLGGLAAAVLVL